MLINEMTGQFSHETLGMQEIPKDVLQSLPQDAQILYEYLSVMPHSQLTSLETLSYHIGWPKHQIINNFNRLILAGLLEDTILERKND